MTARLPFETPLTPLERLLEDARVASLLRMWYEQAEFERRAKAEIHALANYHHRCIGQLARQMAKRLGVKLRDDSAQPAITWIV